MPEIYKEVNSTVQSQARCYTSSIPELTRQSRQNLELEANLVCIERSRLARSHRDLAQIVEKMDKGPWHKLLQKRSVTADRFVKHHPSTEDTN